MPFELVTWILRAMQSASELRPPQLRELKFDVTYHVSTHSVLMPHGVVKARLSHL